VAAERFRIVLSTNLDRDDGLIKVPSPGQLLSEVLECWSVDLPECVAESRFLVHVGHFEKKVRFHSHYSSVCGHHARY
jgi:hypothetical protein